MKFQILLMTIFQQSGPEIPPISQNDDSSYTNFISCNNKTFHFCPTSSNIVFSYLNKLLRSTGLDNISPRLIRECADLISVSLSDLFNKSLTSGIFPDGWKCTGVTPMFNPLRPSLKLKIIILFPNIYYRRTRGRSCSNINRILFE